MISQLELLERQRALKERVESKGLSGAVIFRPERIQYLINFSHLSTERPIVLILPVEGEPHVLIPKLEEEHLQVQASWLTHVHVYFEYPGTTHPMTHLHEVLGQLNMLEGPMGCDNDGFLDQNGYRGPSLSALVNTSLVDVGQIVDEMRLVKSDVEIAIMRECGRWGSVAHRELQAEMVAGKAEREISRLAEEKTYRELEKASEKQENLAALSVHASFRSGARTSMAHAAMSGRQVQVGDNLVTYCQGIYSGYRTELERTLFLGEPTEAKKTYFELVRQAQKIALDLVRPGVPCSEIDLAVQDYFEKENLTQYVQHHQGHGLGLEFHEAPFLDVGDHTILQAGVVISVEPGIYVKGLGGFRHSDTVLVTTSGYEILTPYPSEIEDLIVEPERS